MLERFRAHAPNALVAILTGIYGEPQSASVALKLGASDFWTKPLPRGALAASVRRPSGNQTIRRGRFSAPTPIVRYGIVAASSTMRGVIEWIDRVGPSDIPVLLTGGIGPQRHPI